MYFLYIPLFLFCSSVADLPSIPRSKKIYYYTMFYPIIYNENGYPILSYNYGEVYVALPSS